MCSLSLSTEKTYKIFRVFYLEKLYHNNLFFSFTVMYLYVFMTSKRNLILRAESDRPKLFYQNIFVIVFSNQDFLTAKLFDCCSLLCEVLYTTNSKNIFQNFPLFLTNTSN